MNQIKNSAPCCAFIPVYCYYNPKTGEEIKAPILVADTFLHCFKVLVLNIDSNIYTIEELKDEFIDGYYKNARVNRDNMNSLDANDIHPKLISILHTDTEEINIYVCELYENSEKYFQKKIASKVSYRKDFENLLNTCRIDELTEKILTHLSEIQVISPVSQGKIASSIELF